MHTTARATVDVEAFEFNDEMERPQKRRRTALMAAAGRGYANIVAVLLAKGGDPNMLKSDDGTSPVHGACCADQKMHSGMMLVDMPAFLKP